MAKTMTPVEDKMVDVILGIDSLIRLLSDEAQHTDNLLRKVKLEKMLDEFKVKQSGMTALLQVYRAFPEKGGEE